MKKTKLLKIVFFSFIFFLFLTTTAQAAGNCAWQLNSGELTSDDTKYCESRGLRLVVFGKEYCSEKAPFTMNQKPVCCCNVAGSMIKSAGTSSTSSGDAKFTNPFDKLQIKIPGMARFSDVDCQDGSCEVPWIGQYIAGLYKYAINIGGILAVIVTMIGGLIWLVSAGDASRITLAKEFIGGGVSGLIVLLTSYMLLLQVNPDLIALKPIKIRAIERIEVLSDSSYQAITGKKSIPAFGAEMNTLIKKVAKANNTDECFLYTFVVKESNGRVGAIGHDENVKGTWSYDELKNSGFTYNNVALTDTIKNDDKADATKPDLGLDWRFSHGIGLTQITIFPEGHNYFVGKKDGVPIAKVNGKQYSAKDLFDPETSLQATVDLLKEKNCGTDLKACFKAYNGAGPMAEKYATEAVPIYDACKQKGGI
ncbi:MAG: pilin [Planctomycetes bacterium]|nr:pilin [Planctomycetota bacterium]